MIHQCLVQRKDFTSFNSLLHQGGAERRLWSLLLALLSLARLVAAAVPSSRAVRAHCAAVHILELLHFGQERLRFGAGGDTPTLVVIAANAILFSAWAALGGDQLARAQASQPSASAKQK